MKCSTLKHVRFWELATDIHIRIIMKSYSLIIGNGFSDRSRAPDPVSFLQEPYFGDDDHPYSQDLDQAYFLTVHIFPHFKVLLYYCFLMSFK